MAASGLNPSQAVSSFKKKLKLKLVFNKKKG